MLTPTQKIELNVRYGKESRTEILDDIANRYTDTDSIRTTPNLWHRFVAFVFRIMWHAGSALYKLRGGRTTGDLWFWFGYMVFATLVGIMYLSFAFVFFWAWAILGILVLAFSLIGWYEMSRYEK